MIVNEPKGSSDFDILLEDQIVENEYKDHLNYKYLFNVLLTIIICITVLFFVSQWSKINNFTA
jgi:hypothetical protein